jgi:hypothetical protein
MGKQDRACLAPWRRRLPEDLRLEEMAGENTVLAKYGLTTTLNMQRLLFMIIIQ